MYYRLNLCSYALSELKKDVETELLSYPASERERLRAATTFAVFVVHNKKKLKLAEIPQDVSYVLLYLHLYTVANVFLLATFLVKT